MPTMFGTQVRRRGMPGMNGYNLALAAVGGMYGPFSGGFGSRPSNPGVGGGFQAAPPAPMSDPFSGFMSGIGAMGMSSQGYSPVAPPAFANQDLWNSGAMTGALRTISQQPQTYGPTPFSGYSPQEQNFLTGYRQQQATAGSGPYDQPGALGRFQSLQGGPPATDYAALEAAVQQRAQQLAGTRFGQSGAIFNQDTGQYGFRAAQIDPATSRGRAQTVRDFALGGSDPGDLSPLEQRRVATMQAASEAQAQRREMAADAPELRRQYFMERAGRGRTYEAMQRRKAMERAAAGGVDQQPAAKGISETMPTVTEPAPGGGEVVNKELTLEAMVSQVENFGGTLEEAPQWVRDNWGEIRQYAASSLYPGSFQPLKQWTRLTPGGREQMKREFRQYEAIRRLDPSLPPWQEPFWNLPQYIPGLNPTEINPRFTP